MIPNNCKFQFVSEETGIVQGNLNDISISHFSVTLPEGMAEIAQYEKIQDIAFTIKGLRFHSDAVLYITRNTEAGILYVFAFSTKSGQGGLDFSNKKLLIPKIYEIMVDNCSELLDKLFSSATRQRKNFQKPNLEALTDLNNLIENIDKNEK